MLASRQTLKEINQLNRRVWCKHNANPWTDGWLIALFNSRIFANRDQMTFSEKTGQRALLRIGSEARPWDRLCCD